MTRNRLLTALTAGLMATAMSTAAFAQSDAASMPMQDSTANGAASGTATHHKAKKHHRNNGSSTGAAAAKEKTPDVTTGASAAVTNGQGK